MSVKVSLIVPVYNPGRHIDSLIGSVLRQSLPRDEFEVIFVDDGSTDGTGERLDALAAEHPHVSSLHIPNSGWPGRPRNVGIDAARGRYVYFADNDDYLGDEALERLHDFAEQHGSDVVVGKVVGRGRVIPREMFRRNIERGDLRTGFPLSLLTPHKLFRRSLLDEHGIRFPEGPRRLEDHLFVMAVYLKADVLSVLADYACYYWVERDDATNASKRRFDPRGYYDNLREVLDLVAASTEPGPYRDSLMRHWYRGKVLKRMGGSTLFAYPPDYRAELHAELRALVHEDRWGAGVVDGLRMALRVRSRLLHDGGLLELERLAEVERGMRLDAQLQSAQPLADGSLRFRIEGRPLYADGGPVLFGREGKRRYWELPEDLADLAQLTRQERYIAKAVRKAKMTAILRSTEDEREFVLPTTSRVTEVLEGDLVRIVVTTDVTLDVRSAAAGSPLPAGEWRLVAGLGACGWDLLSDTTATTGPPALPGAVVEPSLAVYATSPSSGRLHVLVDPSGHLPPNVAVHEPTRPSTSTAAAAPDEGVAGARAVRRRLLARQPQLRHAAQRLRRINQRIRG